ncbi:hypothetical protein GCM10009551_079730 [Nocardiopsis tropica]
MERTRFSPSSEVYRYPETMPTGRSPGSAPTVHARFPEARSHPAMRGSPERAEVPATAALI